MVLNNILYQNMQGVHYLICNPVLQGGVVFSNIVTTVSPTYAQEVRTAEVGPLPLHWI